MVWFLLRKDYPEIGVGLATLAIGYGRLHPVKKAGCKLGKVEGGATARSSHHGGHRLSHGALGKAAYLSAGKHVSDSGLVTDYRNKFGVEFSELVLPGGGTCDRERFWNAVDLHPTQKATADVAYDTIIAMPHEFSIEERKQTAKALALWITERYSVAVDYGLHLPEVHKGSDERNFHGHFLVSARKVSETGELGKVQRDLNHRVCKQTDAKRGRTDRKPTAGKEIRMAWGRIANEVLVRNGHEPIDMRSFKERGIDKPPSKHRGAAKTREIRGLGAEISEFALAWREGDRMKPAEAKAELERMTRDLDDRWNAETKKIKAIQDARKYDIVANPSVHVSGLDEFQHDWLGASIRSLRSLNRADQVRRTVAEINANHRIMRDATKEEETILKTAGRTRYRIDKQRGRVERVMEMLGRLHPSAEIVTWGKPNSKMRLDGIERSAKEAKSFGLELAA